MALFLGQGMVAWMLTCSWVAATNPGSPRPCATTAVTVADELRGLPVKARWDPNRVGKCWATQE